MYIHTERMLYTSEKYNEILRYSLYLFIFNIFMIFKNQSLIAKYNIL